MVSKTARSTQKAQILLADDGSLDVLSEITSLICFVLFVFFFVPFVYGSQLTSGGSIRKFKFLLLGGRPMVGLQTLDLAIGVRVPASQPNRIKHLRAAQNLSRPFCVPIVCQPKFLALLCASFRE